MIESRNFSVKKLIFPLVFLVLATVSYINTSTFGAMASSSEVARDGHLVKVSFEVFGEVQGVFFRKYTKRQAESLGLRGWCINTDYETVKGELEGTKERVEEMQEWLRTTGSPKSRIDRVLFSDIEEIPQFSSDSFSIRD